MRPLVCVVILSLTPPAGAWGPEGHSLVARIAETQLTPAVRARVLEILGPGKTLASVASWADEVRRSRPETAAWHYIDIPIEHARLDMERDCAKGDCIVSTISRLRQVLRDPATASQQRTEALMFLIHFVGDMHQPLHCSDHHDRGGNGVQVQFQGRQTNLHSLWDSGLLGRLPPEDALFPDLSRESARHRKGWSKGTVTDWAEQSHKVGRKVVYGKLPTAGEGAPIAIDAAYEATAGPAIQEQLERAGARLAIVLNTELQQLRR
jgi:nuclease S1